jgi:hypothetical protein
MTEAETLLSFGALYGQRVLFEMGEGGPLFAGCKPGAFSLYFGDEPFFHFDMEGRWQRAYADGRHWHKGFDTTVQTIERRREGPNLVLRRRTLSFAEAADFDARARSTAIDLLGHLGADRLDRIEPPPQARPLSLEELREILERIASWDAAAWFDHRERYLDTYGPLPYVPPDCPAPVLLQATLGHAEGLSFGAAPVAEHYVRSRDEFDAHACAVAKLLGRRVLQCRSLFLGGSDVLLRPAHEVAAWLQTSRQVFALHSDGGHRHPENSDESSHQLGGVHTFVDGFPARLPAPADLVRFRSLGLTRVTLGIESADPGVLALYGKSSRAEDVFAFVSDLKSAGLGVGIALLTGAGGLETADRSLEATVDLVTRLPLGEGDLVSLIRASEFEPSPARFTPLPETSWDAHIDQWKTRLAPLRSRKVKIAPYSPDKQAIGLA